MEDPIEGARSRIDILYQRLVQLPDTQKDTLYEVFEEFNNLLEEIRSL